MGRTPIHENDSDMLRVTSVVEDVQQLVKSDGDVRLTQDRRQNTKQDASTGSLTQSEMDREIARSTTKGQGISP